MRWRQLGAAIFLLSQTPMLVVLAAGTLVTAPFYWLAESGMAVILGFRILSFIATAGLAVLGWTTFHWDTALTVSLAIMAAFIAVQTAFSFWWASGLSEQPGVKPDDTAWSTAAQASITTQGVVLGLIAFSDPTKLSDAEQAGAVSLAVGVLVATVLYLEVARVPPPPGRRGEIASVLFALQLWTLGFGLICVVAGNLG